MTKNVKYVNFKDNGTGKIYTLKLIYKTKGTGFGTPEVKILVMKNHDKPISFWDRLTENWKYYENEDIWDPFFTDLSLEDYCKLLCVNKSNVYTKIEKVKTEWGQI